MKPVQATAPKVAPSLALEVFDLPITFHRCLVRVTGSVTAALMLSQAIAWTEELEPGAEGWFSRTQRDWAEEIGLSRWEQETARRTLRDGAFLEERKVGMPARIWFRVNAPALWKVLQEFPDGGGRSAEAQATGFER
jgi:hypothetical protein